MTAPVPSPLPALLVAALGRERAALEAVERDLAAARLAAAEGSGGEGLPRPGADPAPDSPAPLVSVIMPAWNRRATIGRALRSALDQTLTDCEILLVDDGSIDGTDRHVAALFPDAVASRRIRYLRRPHAGVSAARNAGLAAARGQLIAYLDSDNAWHPAYLERMAAAFAAQPLAHSGYAGVLTLDNRTGDALVWNRPFDRKDLLTANFIDLNAFMHRREAAMLGGFDERLTRLVDWEFIIRLTRLAPPFHLPEVLVTYSLGGARRSVTLDRPFLVNHTRLCCLHAAEMRRHGITHWEGKARLLAPLIDLTTPEGFRPAVDLPAAEDAPARVGVVLMLPPDGEQRARLAAMEARGIDLVLYLLTPPPRGLDTGLKAPVRAVFDAAGLVAGWRADGCTAVHCEGLWPQGTQAAAPAAVDAGLPLTIRLTAADLGDPEARDKGLAEVIAAAAVCRRLLVGDATGRAALIRQGVGREKIAVLAPGLAGEAHLADLWRGRGVDIVAMVTGDDPLAPQVVAACESLRRVLELTETAFRLLVVDNGCGPVVAALLDALAAREGAVQLHRLPSPLSQAEAEAAGLAVCGASRVIVLDAARAFALRNGWERPFLDALDGGAAMAGPPGVLARWRDAPAEASACAVPGWPQVIAWPLTLADVDAADRAAASGVR